MRITYAGELFLTDPYLAARHSRPSYAGKSSNPLVELPCTPQEVIAGAGVVVLSHLHSDHFDPAARELLPKELPLVCQPGDENSLISSGFRNTLPVADTLQWKGSVLTRTGGRHGSGSVLDEMGTVSGFVWMAEGEPTLYWTGDTVWCEEVAAVIARHQPDIILTHSCGAVWGEGVRIVMDAEQTLEVCHAAPRSMVVAVHMEALDHATISREQLRAAADAAGILPQRLLIPQDGETLLF